MRSNRDRLPQISSRCVVFVTAPKGTSRCVACHAVALVTNAQRSAQAGRGSERAPWVHGRAAAYPKHRDTWKHVPPAIWGETHTGLPLNCPHNQSVR
jgi:hypothetical protein